MPMMIKQSIKIKEEEEETKHLNTIERPLRLVMNINLPCNHIQLRCAVTPQRDFYIARLFTPLNKRPNTGSPTKNLIQRMEVKQVARTT